MRWLPARRQIIRSDIFLPGGKATATGGNGATGGMNYNRRSTRPDSLFYRDARKMRSPWGRGRGIHPFAFVIAIAALTAIIWWLFLKKP